MKRFLFSILILLLTTAIYNGCQESITDPQSGLNDKLVGGFEVVLVGDKPVYSGGTYTWTWSITKATSKKNLGHWSFVPGCLNRDDIVSAWYRYGFDGDFTEINPVPSFVDEPSMDCDDPYGPVFKFNYGTSGTTFYKLVLNKNYKVDPDARMFYKAGNDCGDGTFDGIGCTPCDEWIVYGTAYGSSDAIIQVDLKSKTSKQIYNPTGIVTGDYNYCNGNAYDPVNKRIYFGTNHGELFYHEIGTNTHQQVDVDLGSTTALASGAWYNGKYYFVKNNYNKLFEVSGNVSTQIGTVPTYNGYGDIVFDPENPGWFIGSAGAGTTALNEVVWYIYNITSKENHILTKVGGTGINTVGGLCHKQLAFGSDGVLYALDTGNNTNTGSVGGRFYTVKIDYTAKTYELTFYWDSGLALTDLADGPLCQ